MKIFFLILLLTTDGTVEIRVVQSHYNSLEECVAAAEAVTSKATWICARLEAIAAGGTP